MGIAASRCGCDTEPTISAPVLVRNDEVVKRARVPTVQGSLVKHPSLVNRGWLEREQQHTFVTVHGNSTIGTDGVSWRKPKSELTPQKMGFKDLQALLTAGDFQD